MEQFKPGDELGFARTIRPIFGRLSTQDLITLPPTEALRAELEAFDAMLATYEEHQRARHQGRRPRLVTRAAEGERRDGLQAERRARGGPYAGCWCLGAGGRRELALRVSDGAGGESALQPEGAPFVTGFGAYCPCPDGRAASTRAAQARESMRALVRRRATNRLVEAARIPGRFRGLTRQTWRERALAAGADRAMVEAIEADLGAWQRSRKSDQPRDLVLAGHYGAGKTGLAAVLAQEALDRDQAVVFRTVPDLLIELRGAPYRHRERYGPEAEAPPLTELEVIRAARDADLLVLDDLGAEAIVGSGQERIAEALYAVIDHRVGNLLPTIYTTNLSRRILEASVGSRLIARLDGAQRVVMKTPNLRQDW